MARCGVWTILTDNYTYISGGFAEESQGDQAEKVRRKAASADNSIGAGMATKFYDLTANLLTGEAFNFSSLQGKVVLIENVASLWGTTTRDYTQMNELHERYAGKGLVILGVPCNQFGHQVGSPSPGDLYIYIYFRKRQNILMKDWDF